MPWHTVAEIPLFLLLPIIEEEGRLRWGMLSRQGSQYEAGPYGIYPW